MIILHTSVKFLRRFPFHVRKRSSHWCITDNRGHIWNSSRWLDEALSCTDNGARARRANMDSLLRILYRLLDNLRRINGWCVSCVETTVYVNFYVLKWA